MKSLLALLLGLILCALPALAANDSPNIVNYQGKLLNSAGASVADGTYTLQFKLYNATSGSSFLWGASYSVVVSGGYFNAMLGEGGTTISGATYTSVVDALSSSPNTYLGITITADASGTVNSPAEITPRLRFLSSPYALVATKAKYAETASTATNAQTLGGLEYTRFLQPASTTATTLNGALTAPTVTVNQTLTVNGAATLQSNLVVRGTLSATATTNGGFVPVGGIIMWSGSVSTLPDGWALCNGTGTITVLGVSTAIPDLRDRFIVGAGSTYAARATGGSTTSTLAADNIPDHRHTYKDTIFSESNINPGNRGPDGIDYGTDSGNNYVGSHSTDSDNSLGWIKRYSDYARGGSSAAATSSFSNLPPYYALAYIIRTR